MKTIALAAMLGLVAMVSAPNPSLAGDMYEYIRNCEYVIGPRGSVRVTPIGLVFSKGRIACTHCGKTTYTYDKSVLKQHNYSDGRASMASLKGASREASTNGGTASASSGSNMK